MFVIWVLDISLPSFIWYLMIYLRRLFALKMMIIFLTEFAIICSIKIGIGMTKMSMIIMASLSTNRHLQNMSGSNSKVVVTEGMKWRISIGIERIVFTRRILRSLILFLWQKITTPGLLRAPLSLTTSQVLIICWYIHLHNKMDIFLWWCWRWAVQFPISQL